MPEYEDITLAELVSRSETSARLANSMPAHPAAGMRVSRFLLQDQEITVGDLPLRGMGRKTGHELLKLARDHAKMQDAPKEPFPVTLSAKAARTVQVLELIEAEGSNRLKELAVENPRPFEIAVAEACLDIEAFVAATQQVTGQTEISQELQSLLEWHAPSGDTSPIDILAELRARGIDALREIEVFHDPRTVDAIGTALRKAIDEYDGRIHPLRDLDRELDVVIRRYGLDGTPPATLRILAEEHSLGNERIRQLENLGLATIRRSTAYEGLRRLEGLAAPVIIAHLELDTSLERKEQIRRLSRLPSPVRFLIDLTDRSNRKWAERRLSEYTIGLRTRPRITVEEARAKSTTVEPAAVVPSKRPLQTDGDKIRQIVEFARQTAKGAT